MLPLDKLGASLGNMADAKSQEPLRFSEENAVESDRKPPTHLTEGLLVMSE